MCAVSAALDTDGDKYDPAIVRLVRFFELPACDREKLEASSFDQLQSQTQSICRLFADGSLWLVPVFGTGGFVDNSRHTCTVTGELIGCNTLRTPFSLSFILLYGDC